MSRYVTWLHISDLHLCEPRSAWQTDKILQKLREDLRKLEEQEGLRPDFVFVTGDVAYGHLGDKPGFNLGDQYDDATLFLQEVLTTYQPALPVERLFIVPGNHDVHRGLVLESTTSWLDAQRKSGQGLPRILKMVRDRDGEWRSIIARLEAYREFLGKKLGATHLLTHPEHLIYSQLVEVQGLKFGIAGLNSAWSCVRDGEKGALWLAGEWQVNTLEQALKPADVRIALMHHPPNWLGVEEDPSVGRLIEGTFHFFLHGHEHQGWVGRASNHVRLAAGAVFGYTDAESGYNLVRLDLETGSASVWLRRYSGLSGGGWVSCSIPGLTDDSGRARLPDLPFLHKSRPPTVPAPHAPPSPQAPAPAAPEEAAEAPVDGAASRGVYGRDAAIQEVSELLSRHAVVAVYGLSGIGKTTLIHEVALTPSFRAMTFRRISADSRWMMADLYSQMARLLGNRDEHPVPPPLILGKRDWSALRRGAQPALILVEHAHLLFDANDQFHDPHMAALLVAIAENAPRVRVVLECRTKISSEVLGASAAAPLALYRVKGLDAAAMAQFFRMPYPERPAIGWSLSPTEAAGIAERLGGERQGGAHPLAMQLLAALAEGLGQSPGQVLDRHAHVLRSRLEEELFRDLFENALSMGERTVLGLCALYRDEIPLVIHANALNAFAKDDHAFQGLERRCLLTAVQSDYFLHALVRELALSRLESREQGHAVVADAWLQTVKQTPARSPERYRAASEAVFHLLEAEQYPRLEELKHMLQRRGDLLTELGERSRYLYQRKRPVENRTVLELLIALDPENHKARNFLGECLELIYGRGNSAALKQYEEAQRLDPTSPRYLSMLGRALLAQNEAGRFIAIIEELPEHFRKQAINDHVVLHWSNALQQLGRGEEASRLRMKYILAGSREPRLFNSEALWLRSQSQPEQALALLARAERRGIATDYSYSVKATLLEDLGQGTESSILRQARIHAGSRNAALYVSEARWLHGQGQSEEALAILSQAGKQGIHNQFTLQLEASILEAVGRREEASALRRRRIEAGDHNPALYFNEIRWLHGEGRSDEALALLAQAKQRGAGNAPILMLEAGILEALGRGEEASALRRRQMNTGPQYPAPYFYEARWLHNQGRSEEALALLNQADALGIHNEFTLKLQVAILGALGRKAEASALLKSRASTGGPPEVYLFGARLLYAQGKPEEALSLLAWAEEEGAASDRTTRYRLTLMEELGRLEEASALRRRMIEAGDHNAQLYEAEAQSLLGRGKLEEALAILLQAMQRGIEHDNIILLRVKLLEAANRSEEASALRRSRIDAGSQNAALYGNEARWLQGQGRGEEALALMALAEQRGISKDYIVLVHAGILEAMGQPAKASALRRSRIEAGSHNPNLFTGEANLLHRQGQSEEALTLLAEAEKRCTPHTTFTELKAAILGALGRSGEAPQLHPASSHTQAPSLDPAADTPSTLAEPGDKEEDFSMLEQGDGVPQPDVSTVGSGLIEELDPPDEPEEPTPAP